MDLIEEIKEKYGDDPEIMRFVNFKDPNPYRIYNNNILKQLDKIELKYHEFFLKFISLGNFYDRVIVLYKNNLYTENVKKAVASMINMYVVESSHVMKKLIQLIDTFEGIEGYLNDEAYCFVINHKISNNSIEYTDDIKRKIAAIFMKNPKFVIKNKFLDDYQKFLDENCHNLSLKIDSAIEIFIDENGKRWCFSPEEWDEIKKTYVNPYTQNCIDSSCILRPFSTKMAGVTLSNKAYKQLKFWVEEIYTFGLVFVKFDVDVVKEFSKTLVKNKTYTLYRGMSFYTEKERDNFVKNLYEIEFHTYSSWTNSSREAWKFSSKKDYGLVLKLEFNWYELLIDINLVENKLLYREEECIALPFRLIDMIDRNFEVMMYYKSMTFA